MKAYLKVTFSDGRVFAIPTGIIAMNRAGYYAQKEADDDPAKFSTIYEEEYQYTVTNSEELLDWAVNNMDWKDLMDFAVQIEAGKSADLDKEWVNAEKEVVFKNAPVS